MIGGRCPESAAGYLDVINGSLPRRAHALVVEWASLHKDELMKNWERCQVPAPAVPIAPLE
jgi:hypothetical protein